MEWWGWIWWRIYWHWQAEEEARKINFFAAFLKWLIALWMDVVVLTTTNGHSIGKVLGCDHILSADWRRRQLFLSLLFEKLIYPFPTSRMECMSCLCLQTSQGTCGDIVYTLMDNRKSWGSLIREALLHKKDKVKEKCEFRITTWRKTHFYLLLHFFIPYESKLYMCPALKEVANVL